MKCEHCNKEFKEYHQLAGHISSKHSNKNYKIIGNKISKTRKRLFREGKLISPMAGKKNQGLAEMNKKRLLGKTYEEIYGKERARRFKNKHSTNMSGKNNPMYGKPHSEGTKKK